MKTLSMALTFLSLLAGILLTAWGLSHLHRSDLPWWGNDALFRYVGFLIVGFVLVIVGSMWSKKNALLVGAMIAVVIAICAGALWPMLVVLWFAVASALLGRSIGSSRYLKYDGDDWLISFLVGAGIYGTAVGLLAHFSANFSGVYGIALAVPVVLGWSKLQEMGKICLTGLAKDSSTEFRIHKLDAAISAVALVYFVVALMPEVGFDALAMHLFIPAHLALRHQWGFDANTYVWAVMPMLGDWIFSIGYMLAGETTARLINIGFIFILAWLVRELVIWGGGSVIGARWAALIFLSTPLTFTEGSSLFIESVWAAFVVAGTLMIFRSCTAAGRSHFELPVAGLFLGCALAAKAVTLTILPVLLLLLAWQYRVWFRVTKIPNFLIGLILLFVIGLVPYLTAWWLTANPVFPFFNGLFHSSYYPAVNFDSASIFGKGLTWDILYRATFESGKYLEANAGASGFQWLLLFTPSLIVLFATRQRKGIVLLLVGMAIIALVFHSVSYFRYAFPAWVILAAAMGVALSTFLPDRTPSKYIWCAIVIVTIVLNLLFLNAGAQYGDFTLKMLGDESRRGDYLQGRVPIRSAAELINRLNIDRTPVAVFANPLTGGMSADALYPNWYNYAFQEETTSTKTEQDVANMLLKRSVDFVILDSNWNGGAEKQNMIKEVTEPVAEFGSISVRKMRANFKFKVELLKDPNFSSMKNWTLSPRATYDTHKETVMVDVASPVFQTVVVSPRRRYKNTVIARCVKEKAQGRIQINWLDAKDQYIRADIQIFDCSPIWAEHAMEVAAPLEAVKAVVYVVGHTALPLEFKSNSLRQ